MKVVGYVRLSAEDKRRTLSEPLLSITNQKKDIEHFCKANGYKLLKIFDEGLAKSQDYNRVEFNSMLSLVPEKVIDAIIVTDSSRFARHQSLLVNKLEYLKAYQTKLLDIKGSDLTKDIMVSGILGAVDQKVVDKSREKQRDMMDRFAREGRPLSRLPLGYKRVKTIVDDKVISKIKVDKEGAEKVKNIFNLFLQGHSISDISNDYGYSKPGVKTILRNKAYLGIYTTKKKHKFGENKKVATIEEKEYPLKNWKNLIDEDTFNKAQEKLKSNKW